MLTDSDNGWSTASERLTHAAAQRRARTQQQRARRRIVYGAGPSLRRGGAELHSPPCSNPCADITRPQWGYLALHTQTGEACARRNARQRRRMSTQRLPLGAYPLGHDLSFGTVDGGGRSRGVQ